MGKKVVDKSRHEILQCEAFLKVSSPHQRVVLFVGFGFLG